MDELHILALDAARQTLEAGEAESAENLRLARELIALVAELMKESKPREEDAQASPASAA